MSAAKKENKKSGMFAKKKAKQEQGEKKASVSDYQVLLKPVITEKSALVSTQGNNVVFRVDPRSTKDDVRQAVQRIFNVEVVRVRICNYLGKMKRQRTSIGRRAGFKKAYVSLKEGQSIDVVEGI